MENNGEIQRNPYDNIPVLYCKRCLSLAVMSDDDLHIDYCDKCGCADIGETDIYTWMDLYEKKYGKKYI